MTISSYLSILKSLVTLPRRAPCQPRHIQLDITTACNLNCRMCYAKTAVNDTDKQKFLDLAHFEKIWEMVRPVSVNLAASGEPFLNPDLSSMIRYAHARGTQVIISTNFLVPDEAKIRDVVDSGLDILKISIDGVTKETYGLIRGPYFEKLCSNISLLNRILKERKAPRPSVRIDYVILKPNAAEMPEIIDFAAENGIGHVFFRICDPRGWNRQQRAELLDGSFDAVRASMKIAVARARARGIKTNLDGLLAREGTWRFIYEDSTVVPAHGPERPVCILPWMQLFVSVTGEMNCCCSIYPDGGHTLGNIFGGDNWNSRKWQDIRFLFKVRRNYGSFEGCRYCIPMSRRYLFDVVRMFPGYVARFISSRARQERS